MADWQGLRHCARSPLKEEQREIGGVRLKRKALGFGIGNSPSFQLSLVYELDIDILCKFISTINILKIIILIISVIYNFNNNIKN